MSGKFTSKINSIIILVITLILAGLSAALLFFFFSFNKKLNRTEEDTVYKRYYALITDNVTQAMQVLEEISERSDLSRIIDRIKEFVELRIGTFAEGCSTRDAYFGNSAFVDFIHQMQLQITGAEISLNAPLSFDASIEKGPDTVADMPFNVK